MWRYRQVLPDVEPVTLGEGWTPILKSRQYENVWLKEEGANPTGTFKARGLALAVTMARHYGLKKLAAPTAGMPAALWRRMRRRPALRHTFLCRATPPKPTRWSAARTARR